MFERLPLNKTVSFRVTTSEHERLKSLATERGMEIVGLIRAALEAYVGGGADAGSKGQGFKGSRGKHA